MGSEQSHSPAVQNEPSHNTCAGESSVMPDTVTFSSVSISSIDALNKPLDIKIFKCETSCEPNSSEIMDILEELNCLVIKVATGQAAVVWVGDSSQQGTNIVTFSGESPHVRRMSQPDNTCDPITKAKSSDNKVNDVENCRKIIIEWENKIDSCRVVVNGYCENGQQFHQLTSDLPHVIQRLCLNSLDCSADWHFMLCNRNEGWVPSGWGLHPSTAVRLPSRTHSSVCLARAYHQHLYDHSVIAGQLVPKEHLRVIHGCDVHAKHTYEVLCNVMIDWRRHEEGDSLDVNAIEAGNSLENEKWIGRVTVDYDEQILGKVEYRQEDCDYVCHYYYEGESRFLREFEYLVLSS